MGHQNRLLGYKGKSRCNNSLHNFARAVLIGVVIAAVS